MMRYYTVHAPPDEPAAPERFVFVKDGFSWPALFFPVLWILWHRLWLTLVWYVVFVLVVAWVGRGSAATISRRSSRSSAALLFALRGERHPPACRSTQRGWRRGRRAASGGTIDEAEARFFADAARSWRRARRSTGATAMAARRLLRRSSARRQAPTSRSSGFLRSRTR